MNRRRIIAQGRFPQQNPFKSPIAASIRRGRVVVEADGFDIPDPPPLLLLDDLPPKRGTLGRIPCALAPYFESAYAPVAALNADGRRRAYRPE